MMEQIDHLQLFLFLVGLVAAWSLIMMGVQKSIMAVGFKTLGDQIMELKKASEKIQGFERQILELKADLPLNYVRKEDFIRHEVVINAKLDRLRDLLEDLKEKKHGF
jgi:hypothetical protein